MPFSKYGEMDHFSNQLELEKCSTEPQEIKKKKHGWAIKYDLIFAIVFVLCSTAWYKSVILGEYWGEALHSVGEANNDSFLYQSSEDEDEHQTLSSERDIQD